MLASLATSVRRRFASLPPFAVLAIAWLVLAIYAYPGQMTRDSFDQLSEARSGAYTDGHPPAMSLLWKLVELVVSGPFGMFVIQSVMFLAGLFLLLRRTFAPRRAAWIASAVFLFPPVMTSMAVVWKDCLMAGFLVLAIAALLSDRLAWRVVGLVLVFAATAVRYNALAGTLPIIVLVLRWPPTAHWLIRWAIGAVAWVVVTFAAFRFNGAITDHPMYFWHSSLAVHDIAGTIATVDDDLPDAELLTLLEGTGLQRTTNVQAVARIVYDPRDHIPTIAHEQYSMWNLPLYGTVPAPQAQRDAVGRAWWGTITRWPGAYLEHRFTVFFEMLSWGDATPQGAITRRDNPAWDAMAKDMGITLAWSPLQKRMTRWCVYVWRYTGLFVPWIYLVVALALLPLAWRHRDALVLLLSALSFWGALIFLAPSADFRYSHWPIICVTLSVVLLVARRYRQARPAANTKQASASQASAQ